ncbi:hypothetical protein BGZ83_008783 [Gryganskiella cystojenkinii]|nr:hypothetical protein BGZ83_008783 [Gryganskiella cystojenkinii]
MPLSRYLIDPAFLKTFLVDNYSYDQIPDLTGKIALVTGANAGLGYQTTVGLVAHGAKVIMACRSQEKYEDAVLKIKDDIKSKYPRSTAAKNGPLVEFLGLDLNDLKKTQASAQQFLDKGLPLHLLVLNSGISGTPWALSADGIEQHFAINHMGHFVFTLALLNRLKECQPSRIVVVSSIAHEISVPGFINFDLISDKSQTPMALYGQSKFANMLFTKALARRLEKERVYVNAIHPGFVNTDMAQNNMPSADSFASSAFKVVANRILLTPERGALTQLYAATSPQIENNDWRGQFFIPIGQKVDPSPLTEDKDLQERLWAYSEDLVRKIFGRVLKYTGHYLAGRSPKGQCYSVGCGVAMLHPPEEYLNIHQARAFLRLGIRIMDSDAGIGSEMKKAEIDHTKVGLSATERILFVQESAHRIGQGCDKVVLYAHGGGFIDGNARMYLDIFRRMMATAYESQKIKIGFLSIEYSLSPETPFPGALHECVAAYKDLLLDHLVDPKNIIFVGDSAGGNLAVTVALMVRDTFPTLPLPSGIISMSPYLGSYEPFENSLYDYISPIGCQAFVEHYTQLRSEVLSSPYYSPLNAASLAGLPRMLVYVGGEEIFRPSIELFAERARRDGVEVELEVGIGRSHDYIMVPQICLDKEILAAHLQMSAFMARDLDQEE